MTRVYKQITLTSQEIIDSKEEIKRNDEFSIHTKATSDQAIKRQESQKSKPQSQQQFHARESTETTGGTTATASKTKKDPTTIPPTNHPPVNSIETTNSSIKLAFRHEQVSHPQASVWISGPPKASLSVISSSDAHLPRNVQGDAAWPPVRPPSSVPGTVPDVSENHRELEVAAIRFQGDLSAATSGALNAWRVPAKPVGEAELAAAIRMLDMGGPQSSKTQVSRPRTCGLQPAAHVPRAFDPEALRDPEAEVRVLLDSPDSQPRYSAPRYYSNKEANKSGDLTGQPRPRHVRDAAAVAQESECSGVNPRESTQTEPSTVPLPLAVGDAGGSPAPPDTGRNLGPGTSGVVDDSGPPAPSRDQARPSHPRTPPEEISGDSDDMARAAELSGTDRSLPSRLPPQGLSMTGFRSETSSRGVVPARTAPGDTRFPGTDVSTETDTDPLPEERAAAAPGPVFLLLPPKEPERGVRTRLLLSLIGHQYLQDASTVGQCRNWRARVGVSWGGAGSLSARVLEGATSTPREPHAVVNSGGMMVGHVWSVTIERVRPVDEQGEIQSEAADGRIRRILGRFEKQLNEIRDGAAVVDEDSMQSLVLRLQSLLTGLSRSSGLESCDNTDPRILTASPTLAPPKRREESGRPASRGGQISSVSPLLAGGTTGGAPRPCDLCRNQGLRLSSNGGCSERSSDEGCSERPAQSTDEGLPLQSGIPLNGMPTAGSRSAGSDRGGAPAQTALGDTGFSGCDADTAAGIDSLTEDTAAAASGPDRAIGLSGQGQVTLPSILEFTHAVNTEPGGDEPPTLLYSLVGSQYLPAESIVGQCYRWVVRVGVSLDSAGLLSARILEGVTSTPREPHMLGGELVGHMWIARMEWIPLEDTQGEGDSAAAAAEEQLRSMLEAEGVGDQLDETWRDASVHDEGSMQSLVLRLQGLLKGLSRSRGLERNSIPESSGIPESRVTPGERGGEGGHAPREERVCSSGRSRATVTLAEFLPPLLRSACNEGQRAQRGTASAGRSSERRVKQRERRGAASAEKSIEQREEQRARRGAASATRSSERSKEQREPAAPRTVLAPPRPAPLRCRNYYAPLTMTGSGDERDRGQGEERSLGQDGERGRGLGDERVRGLGEKRGSGPGAKRGRGPDEARGRGSDGERGRGPAEERGRGPVGKRGRGPVGERGSEPGGVRSRGPGKERGSEPSEERGRGPSDKRGCGPGEARGRRSGGERGREPAKERGRGPGDERGRGPLGERGSEPGSETSCGSCGERGRGPGDERGCGPGEERGRGPGGEKGRRPGDKRGLRPGEERGRGPGGEKGRGPGRDRGSGQGEERGRGPDDKRGRGPGKERGSGPGEERGRGPGDKRGCGPGEARDRRSGGQRGRGQAEERDRGQSDGRGRGSVGEKGREPGSETSCRSCGARGRGPGDERGCGPGEERGREPEGEKVHEPGDKRGRGPGEEKGRGPGGKKGRGPGKERGRGPDDKRGRESGEERDSESGGERGRGGPAEERGRGPGGEGGRGLVGERDRGPGEERPGGSGPGEDRGRGPGVERGSGPGGKRVRGLGEVSGRGPGGNKGRGPGEERGSGPGEERGHGPGDEGDRGPGELGDESGSGSRVPRGERRGGWSLRRPHRNSVAAALQAVTAEGALSSRIPAGGEEWGSADEGMDPVAMVRHRGQGPWGDRGRGGGTAHRRVCWGRPNPSLNDSRPAPVRDQYGPAQVLGKSFLDRSDVGRPLAIRHPPHPQPPSLAEPERGGQSNIHDWQGVGANLGRMWNSSLPTSSLARGDLYVKRARGADVEPPRVGTEMRPLQISTTSVLGLRVTVRTGKESRAVPVTQRDWYGLDHNRHGPCPDLVVALCLRQNLRCAELVNIELVSHDALILHREEWPASWEEFGSFVEGGGTFRVGAILRGGMDPARQALLDTARFALSDSEWSLLDRCLEAVRSQGPRPAEASSGLVTLAELLFEATRLGRWTILHGSAAELQGRCNLTPARISALAVLLGRPRVRTWRLPPCVTAGQAGQHIELRFNSIPPPPGYLGEAISAEVLKDEVLDQLARLAPAMWADVGFNLRTVRKSIRLEGNLTALQSFSLTVLLPFGAWVTSFLKGELSLGPGSYATVGPIDTHIEVELSRRDHKIFRAIRLSLGLNHTDSLALLEDGLSRALQGTPVACRFTTSRRAVGGGGGGGAKGKPLFVHHSPDDEDASTLFTIEAAYLLVARRQALFINVSLGEGDDQRPITVQFQLPACPQAVLHRMVESRAIPPIRARNPGTLFVDSNVLVGPLPAKWLTNMVAHSSSEEERMRSIASVIWRGCVQAEDVHFVGRRDKGDRNPLFLYVEFPSVVEANAFGSNMDGNTLPAGLVAFWGKWFGRTVPVWSCAVLTEALEVVLSKAWKGLLEQATQNPCPPPPLLPPLLPPPDPAAAQAGDNAGAAVGETDANAAVVATAAGADVGAA